MARGGAGHPLVGGAGHPLDPLGLEPVVVLVVLVMLRSSTDELLPRRSRGVPHVGALGEARERAACLRPQRSSPPAA